MASTPRQDPSYLLPDALYKLRGFWIASGISPTRIREARRRGIELPVLNVGRRKFVRGIDAVQFVEKLAAL